MALAATRGRREPPPSRSRVPTARARGPSPARARRPAIAPTSARRSSSRPPARQASRRSFAGRGTSPSGSAPTGPSTAGRLRPAVRAHRASPSPRRRLATRAATRRPPRWAVLAVAVPSRSTSQRQHDRALELDHGLVALVEAARAYGDDAEARSRIRLSLLEHFGLGAERVPGEDRRRQPHLAPAEVDAALGDVRDGQARYEREREGRVDERPSPLGRRGVLGVEVDRVRVQ